MRDFFREWIALIRGNSDKTYKIGNMELTETALVRVISGLCFGVVLYVVGLFAELINNYSAYMDNGGFVSGKMPAIKFAPYIAAINLFSRGGLIAVFIISVACIGIWICVKYKNSLFGGDEYDERGFKKTKDGIYGTADWMTEKEAREVLEVGGINTVRGNILGERNGRLYCLPVETRFNRHTMIIGASGTMKSRAIIRNHLFQAIRRGESVAITDPKGEMFSDSYELFKKYGYNVKVLNLVNPEHGNRWNCMNDLNGDTLMAQMLTNIIIGNTTDGKGDQFWDNGERNLLKALILYVDNNESIPKEEKSLAKVYEILTQNSEKELYRLFDGLPPNHPAKTSYNLFARADDKVKSGFVLGLGTRLQVLQVEAVKELISGNDIDVTALGKEKTAFFVILSDQDTTMKFISSLFFSLMFVKLTRYADEQPDRKCAVPVNLLLDEFNNVGRIGGAEDGSDFARTLSVIRSRDVRVTIAIQSLGQLQNRYPKNLWAELQGNCDIQIMLGCTDDITAEYISARSGEMSIQVDSTRRSRKAFALFEVVPDYSQTEGKGKRHLLTPDEVLRLDRKEELVILRGYNVLKLNKWDYTNHPMSKEIRQVSLFDYYADGMDYEAVEKKEAEKVSQETKQENVETDVPGTVPEKDSIEYMLGGIVDSNATGTDGGSFFTSSQSGVSADDDAYVDTAETTETETPEHKNSEEGSESEKNIPPYMRALQKSSEEKHKSKKTDGEYKVDYTTGEVLESKSDGTDEKEGTKKQKQRNPNRPGASANNPITISKNSDDISGF